MGNRVRGLAQTTSDRVKAKGRYALVKVDNDQTYNQSRSGILLNPNDIERPPLLTGVVQSIGEGKVVRQGGRSWLDNGGHSVGDRVAFMRGYGHTSWHEDGVEYRMLDVDQIEKFTLDIPDGSVLRMKYPGQEGIMD